MEPMQQPWARTADEALRLAGGHSEGLRNETARQRLTDCGPNVLKEREQELWYRLLLRQFQNPLVYLLLAAAVVKAYVKGWVDAAVIGTVLLFMALIGFLQEMRARKAMAALLELSAPRARVRREGKTLLLDAADLVPGDVLVLESGDRVPADARLLEITNLSVNESTFTGESMPVRKDVRPVSPETPCL